MQPRALVLYKIVPKIRISGPLHHTNEIEIPALVSVLVRLGFHVTLLDRSAERLPPLENFDLFIGLGTSGSSNLFDPIAKELPKSCTRILLATTPNPVSANRLRREHLTRFHKKYGRWPEVSRIDPSEKRIQERIAISDHIWVYGEPNTFSADSFFGLHPSIHYFPPTSLISPPSSLRMPDEQPKRFVWFGGSGMIAKGADLVVEAFQELPFLRLDLYGPSSDPEFQDIVVPSIQRSSNMKFKGFLSGGPRKYCRELGSGAAQVLLSPSEGFATSVLTPGIFGVPLIGTHETSVNPLLFAQNLGRFDSLTIDGICGSILSWVNETSTTRLTTRSMVSETARTFLPDSTENRIRKALIPMLKQI